MHRICAKEKGREGRRKGGTDGGVKRQRDRRKKGGRKKPQASVSLSKTENRESGERGRKRIKSRTHQDAPSCAPLPEHW